MTSQQTVLQRLQQMREDLIALALCCNRDRQYDEAAKLQGLLVQLAYVDIQCAASAVWPPQVNLNAGGDSEWVCVDG